MHAEVAHPASTPAGPDSVAVTRPCLAFMLAWIGILPAQYHIGVDCGIATGGWSRYFEALPRWSTCAEGQMGSFDIITLIFLALAVFVIFKLRSVLGERTGAEPPPPENLRRDPVQPTVRD